ncbi:hypothetical protein BDF14DRAFT_1974660 [Spinellus fusiger]|nr:hypothetical protein BDF14DRAFT_1974660 [Spinellus fusiger]
MKAWQFLSSGWTNFMLPTNIQKRLYKFLLRKAIGQFLANELDLENFDIELVNGSVELRDLDLNLQTLNECLIDTPFVLESGKVASISASLPWANFWSGDIALRIQGLHLTLRPTKDKPKKQKGDTTREEEVIMSSSLHFADDFLRTEIEPDQNQALHESIQYSLHNNANGPDPPEAGIEGLQVLTRVIDKMLAKVKIEIVDILVRVAHTSSIPLACDRDTTPREYFIDLAIERISYFDETPEFISDQPNQPLPARTMAESSILLPPVADETIKIINVTSPTLHIRSNAIPVQAVPSQSETTLMTEQDLSRTEFYEVEQGDSILFHTTTRSYMSGSITPRAYPRLGSFVYPKAYERLLFSTMEKDNWLRIKLHPSYPFDGHHANSTDMSAIKQLDMFVTHIRAVITPQQTAFLLEVMQEMASPSDNTSKGQRTDEKKEHDFTQRSTAESYILKDLDTSLAPPLSSLPTPRTAPGRQSSTPRLKVKLQISLVEVFAMYQDSMSNVSWQLPDSECLKDIGHLKLTVEQIVMRLQQFPDDSKETRIQQRTQSNPRFQPGSSTSSPMLISSTIDLRIIQLLLEEWIKKPSGTPSMNTSNVLSDSLYDSYSKIIMFDPSMPHEYDNAPEFPSLNHTKVNTTVDKIGVIRLRIEKSKYHQVNRFIDAVSYNEDTSIDLQPMRISLDPRIADRMEDYVYALVNLTRQNKDATHPKDMNTSDGSYGQRIYDDLDQYSTDCQQYKSVRVKFAFIRLLLHVPDMSHSSTRDESNDKLHAELLSVDIRRIVGFWKNDEAENKGSSPRQKGTSPNAYAPQQGPSIDSSTVNQPTKISVEVNSVHIYVTQSKDALAQCFFTANTTLSMLGTRSDQPFAAQSPTFEITVRSSDLYPTPASARPGYFGAGSDIPSNLFDHLSRNESFNGEQKLHVPMEDQSESAMMFKQRTVETALIVLNCHFPVTRMNLTKSVWDTVQVLQNDLLLWQPHFTAFLSDSHNIDSPYPMSIESSIHDILGNSDYRMYSDGRSHSVLSSSVLSQSHERLGFVNAAPASSLFALVAFISDALWDLSYTPEKGPPGKYQARLTEFRYFAVMKHLNTNENITTLDIDEIALDDISDPMNTISIVYKTIPKTLNATRNTAMISLFSRLTTFPEINKQDKVTSVVICNLCHKFSSDLTFMENLMQFQKVPEEMVYIDPPTQYIKVYVHVLDTSIDYKPLNTPSRSVIVIDDFQVITDILAGQPLIDIKTYIQTLDVFLIDDASELNEKKAEIILEQLENKATNPRRYWMTVGLVPVLMVHHLETRVKIKLDPLMPVPATEIAVLNSTLTVEGSADSFQSLVNLLTYIANQGDITTVQPPQKKKTDKRKSRRRSHVSLSTQKENMLSSLDEDAFRRFSGKNKSNELTKDKESSASDLSYVEGYYSGQPKIRPTSSLSSPYTSSFLDRGPQKPQRKYGSKRKAEDIIRVLITDEDELEIVEGFFDVDKKAEAKKSMLNLAQAIMSIRVDDFDILWKLYDGYDWAYMRSDIDDYKPTTHPNSHPMAFSSSPMSNEGGLSMPTTESALGVSPTEYFPLPSNSPSYSVSDYSVSQGPPEPGFLDENTFATSLNYEYFKNESPQSDADIRHTKSRTNAHHRRKRRSRTPKIEISFEGLSVALDVMPHSEQTGLHLKLTLRDLEMIDNIKTSSWKKFLGYMRPDASSTPREKGSSMIDIELTGVRPVPQDPTQEFRFKVELLPIRLYVDQDALDFLVSYFTFDKMKLRSTSFTNDTISRASASKDNKEKDAMDKENKEGEEDEEDESPLFFQHVEICPIVLKVDYKPKYISYNNIKEGQLAELINLFHLDGAEIALNHVKLTGIAGIERLLERLGQEWLPHIKNTQVPSMVSGVAPIRSIVNLSSGVADLVLLPIQQYRKDGRIIKGIQKGTQSFARATAIEAINISARFASGTQVILEHADGFFSSSSSSSSFSTPHHSGGYTSGTESASVGTGAFVYTTIGYTTDSYQQGESDDEHESDLSAVSKFAEQPNDLSQGFQYAYQRLSKNIGSAAQTIFAVPTEIRERGLESQGTSAKAVIKAVPVAVLRPMIGLTGAFQSILVGLRNTIDPTRRLQSEDVSKMKRNIDRNLFVCFR